MELAAYVEPRADHSVLDALGPVRIEEVAAGWEEAWKAFHRGVRVGPLWIGPPWERPPAGAAAAVVDPGQAFGTGAHPTTRLSLELILRCQRGSALDLGCGSGVLAVAAARLGFGPVLALDADPAAVEAARRNAALNSVRVEARRVDVLEDPLPPADLVVANISLAAAETLAARVRASDLILSGYLATETPRAPDWHHEERREADGWAADRFVRLPGATRATG